MEELVTSEGGEALARLVGARIMYGLVPDANLTWGAHVEGWEEWRGERGVFVQGHVLVLRVEGEGSRGWVTVAPGPDAPVEPWAPMWVREAAHLDEVPGLEPWHLKGRAFGGRADGLRGAELDAHMDTHVDGLGMTRLSCWTGGAVRRVEVHAHPPYAALVVEHDGGARWSCWAEYDFAFWVNVSGGVADALAESSERHVTWGE
jgi:hypothetical protein